VTERLYYTDAYLTAFTGRVEAVDDSRVWLDRTAFYPTSGGQPCDTGVLGGARVVEVVDDGLRVWHVLESRPQFTPGTTVEGRLDWPRRFDHMQQHTGQHVLSAIFEDLFGHTTVSVHFGAESSTLDLEVQRVPRERAAEVERRANTVVAENRPVTVTFEDAATAGGLRKPPERGAEIRVVSIEGLDRSACGGTHVRATGEIGAVLIRRLEKYKKLTRVEFLCGARAIARARADYDTLSALAASLTAGLDELPALVAAQVKTAKEADAERRRLAKTLASYRARERYDGVAPGADGVRRVVERGASVDELRALAHAVTALPKAVMVGVCEPPHTVVFAASGDSGVNAGATLKAALSAHGGRGGGTAAIAQGTVGDAAALDAVLALLRDA
jgi:alanyl-tRNA synthetase